MKKKIEAAQMIPAPRLEQGLEKEAEIREDRRDLEVVTAGALEERVRVPEGEKGIPGRKLE